MERESGHFGSWFAAGCLGCVPSAFVKSESAVGVRHSVHRESDPLRSDSPFPEFATGVTQGWPASEPKPLPVMLGRRTMSRSSHFDGRLRADFRGRARGHAHAHGRGGARHGRSGCST